MNLPFTIDQFLKNFSDYNQAIFPLQFVFAAVAIVLVYLAIRPNKYSSKIISGALGFFWLWAGIVYHILFFSTINPIAKVFGLIFIVQGLFFLYFGFLKEKMQFSFKNDNYSTTGLIIIAYALIIYPALGYFFGHVYPASPTFGAPCPTTIFTFGMLLLASKPLVRKLLIIPFAWSIIGFSAAISLGVREDIGLLVAGMVTAIMIRRKNRTY